MDANIRELKAHLSQYVRRAEQGETFRVKTHQREVARLVPPQTRVSIADLQALPGLRWQGGKPGGMSGERVSGGTTMAEAVIEDRR
jgi:prevent-host-death family protein